MEIDSLESKGLEARGLPASAEAVCIVVDRYLFLRCGIILQTLCFCTLPAERQVLVRTVRPLPG